MKNGDADVGKNLCESHFKEEKREFSVRKNLRESHFKKKNGRV